MVALVVAAIAGAAAYRARAVRTLPVVATLVEAAGPDFHLVEDEATFAVSPDGSTVVFVGQDSSGQRALWLRRLDGAAVSRLAGTDGATNPFWSPDGSFIAFFANDKLQTVDLRGSPPRVLCEVGLHPHRGSWNRDGVIIFSPSALSSVYRVSAAGGKATPLTTLDVSRNETTHRWASFLPDGRHFLYLAASHGSSRESESNRVLIGDLAGGLSTPVTQARSNVEYSRGHLLYARGGVLLAQRFDLRTLTVSGDPIPLAQRVGYDPGAFLGLFSASSDGVLVFATANPSFGKLTLERLDGNGKKEAILADEPDMPVSPFAPGPAMSPSGDRIVFERDDVSAGSSDLWLLDFKQRVTSRFTFGSADERYPIWSPDGKMIAFSSTAAGLEIRVKSASGATDERVLPSSKNMVPSAWSPDGRSLLATRWDPRKMAPLEVMLYSLEQQTMRPFLSTGSGDQAATFSPDGQWVAWVSGPGDRAQIYVTSFASPGTAKWQISPSGTDGRPEWIGNEIFYRKGDTLMAVPVTEHATAIEAREPHQVLRDSTLSFVRPAPDGHGFIGIRRDSAAGASPIELVTNWASAIDRP